MDTAQNSQLSRSSDESVTYKVPCLFIGVHVNVLKERAELVDLARMGGLLELFVGHRDVTLLSIEEAPSIIVSLEHRGQRDPVH